MAKQGIETITHLHEVNVCRSVQAVINPIKGLLPPSWGSEHTIENMSLDVCPLIFVRKRISKMDDCGPKEAAVQVESALKRIFR